LHGPDIVAFQGDIARRQVIIQIVNDDHKLSRIGRFSVPELASGTSDCRSLDSGVSND